MVADKSLVRERLDKIRQHRGLLKQYEKLDVGLLKKDYGKQMEILHLLQIAIEACIDIASHIVSADQLGAPINHPDLFKILGEHGIIGENFVSIMQEMTRFRNRLVHFYLEVDVEQVVSILNNHLKDFDSFVLAVEKYLQKE